MKSGKYYVGDLCYVMNDEWEEVCNIYDEWEDVCILSNGKQFAMFPTQYGDGVYHDNHNNIYYVDSGTIGCILVDDISKNEKNDIRFGNIITFNEDFEVYENQGYIYIGNVIIDTIEEEEDY